jgi:hypothetical protein
VFSSKKKTLIMLPILACIFIGINTGHLFLDFVGLAAHVLTIEQGFVILSMHYISSSFLVPVNAMYQVHVMERPCVIGHRVPEKKKGTRSSVGTQRHQPVPKFSRVISPHDSNSPQYYSALSTTKQLASTSH